jgi:NADPH-dependent 2,4-dienoyl-CoA reductase/sulfur reductase-like enzyme
VAIIGGGLVGCETTLHLAQSGKKVTIIEILDSIARDVFLTNQTSLYANNELSDNHLGKNFQERDRYIQTNREWVRVVEVTIPGLYSIRISKGRRYYFTDNVKPWR